MLEMMKFWNWFKVVTTEDIVAPVQKMLNKLHDHAEAHFDKADGHAADATLSSELASAACNEALKAKALAAKFGSLLSVG